MILNGYFSSFRVCSSRVTTIGLTGKENSSQEELLKSFSAMDLLDEKNHFKHNRQKVSSLIIYYLLDKT